MDDFDSNVYFDSHVQVHNTNVVDEIGDKKKPYW